MYGEWSTIIYRNNNFIQCRHSDPGEKTVIPAKVIGKFSIRLVPNQKPEEIEALVKHYLEEKMAQRGSPNKFKLVFNYFQ